MNGIYRLWGIFLGMLTMLAHKGNYWSEGQAGSAAQTQLVADFPPKGHWHAHGHSALNSLWTTNFTSGNCWSRGRLRTDFTMGHWTLINRSRARRCWLCPSPLIFNFDLFMLFSKSILQISRKTCQNIKLYKFCLFMLFLCPFLSLLKNIFWMEDSLFLSLLKNIFWMEDS